MHKRHYPSVAILFSSFGLLAPKLFLNYLSVQSFDYERMLFESIQHFRVQN